MDCVANLTHYFWHFLHRSNRLQSANVALHNNGKYVCMVENWPSTSYYKLTIVTVMVNSISHFFNCAFNRYEEIRAHLLEFIFFFRFVSIALISLKGHWATKWTNSKQTKQKTTTSHLLEEIALRCFHLGNFVTIGFLCTEKKKLHSELTHFYFHFDILYSVQIFSHV